MAETSTAPPDGYKTTELGPLPEEWEVVRLDDVARLRSEGINPEAAPHMLYVGLEHMDPGDNRLQRRGNAFEVKSNKSRFFPDDILYGKLRPYLDKAVLARQEGMCSTDILVFAPAANVVPAFLSHLLHSKSFIGHAVATTTGVNHPRTSWSSLRGHLVPLPPLPEQRVIVHVLRTVQQARETTEKVIASTKELKKSLMRHLFTYGPVPMEEAEGVMLKETRYGSAPKHWKVTNLEECAFVQTGVTKGRKLEGSDIVEVPYLRVANVQDGYLDLQEVKHIRIRESEMERYRLRMGDVLLTEGGDFDKLGRGFIWQGQIPECIHQNHVFAVRADAGVLVPEYLAYLAQSQYGKAYFLNVAHRTTNLASINSTKLKAFPVLIPPLPEQQEITYALSTVDQKIAAEENRKRALEALFKTLLHHLMTGKLRVEVELGG